MWGAGVGVGEEAGSRGSTRMASRERGIGAAFEECFEADVKVGTEARKGRRRNAGIAAIRILEVGCVVGSRWPGGRSCDRLQVFSVVQRCSNTPASK